MKIHLYDPQLRELSLHDGPTVAVPHGVIRRFRFNRGGAQRMLVLVVLWAISSGHIHPVDEVRCVTS